MSLCYRLHYYPLLIRAGKAGVMSDWLSSVSVFLFSFSGVKVAPLEKTKVVRRSSTQLSPSTLSLLLLDLTWHELVDCVFGPGQRQVVKPQN
jgi:hypothetical protein